MLKDNSILFDKDDQGDTHTIDYEWTQRFVLPDSATGVPTTFYAEFAALLNKYNAAIILETEGEGYGQTSELCLRVEGQIDRYLYSGIDAHADF